MSDLKKLGANIRSLRIAYGETQEQLGEAIFVEKILCHIMRPERESQTRKR